MLFRKKLVTPDMNDWHHSPENLVLKEAGVQLKKMSCTHDKPLVIFVGGAMDDLYKPLLNGVFIPYRIANHGQQDIVYTTHNSIKAITHLIKKWSTCDRDICLIGHSWGGQTVINSAKQLSVDTNIKLLITLDPVSMRFNNHRQQKPENVSQWVNVFVDYTKARNERSNIIARIGGYWGCCQYADRNVKLSKKKGLEVTHARADLMFDEVKAEVLRVFAYN